MIILKASTDLKVIFNKLINTMGINHKWTELFLIKNNNLILHGKSTILVFDFGTKVISCNTAEVTLVEEKTQQITDNELLVNVINMTLYTFGKWGKIKGLTVEKDYQQINSLFGNFLKQINVEPILTDDNLKFVRNGILITYEEIIELILKEQIQKEDGTENSEVENIDKDKVHNKYDIGLWRKIVWTSGHYAFEKEKLTEYDKMKARIGNNFYRVSYLCPICKDKLYMVVYPYGKELLIESDEKGIYLARAYTCTTCHQLFTPKPHMLLIDGSVFALDFEDDSEAYADYIELIGKQGEKSSNCNFNEYEVDYFKSKKNGEEQLEAICTDMELLSDKEIVELQDKMDSGFYPKESTNKFYQAVENVLISRRYPKQEKDDNLNEIKKHKNSKLTIETVNENKTQALTNRLTKERRHKLKDNKKRKSIHKVEKPVKIKPNYILQYNTDRKQVNNQLHESMRKETLISSQNSMTNSSINIQPIISDLRTDLTIKDNIVGNAAKKNKVTELLQKVESCKDKNYIHIHRVFEDLKKADYNYSIKEPFIISLKDMMEKQGKRELDALRLKIPANISKAQYIQLNETIEQYKEIDYSSYKKHLDNMRVEAEKQEIVSYIKRANARDRSTYMSLYQKLKTEDFDENNVKPFLENIYDKIYNIDEKTIYTICHDPANLTFEEGLEALEEISLKDLLPELKSKTLETIEQRLTKIKRNECEKLVSKISKEMDKIKINNTRIHYYDVRSGVRSNHNDEESIIINKALNSFAESRGRYEFPILICDASVKANGTSGFVLTPDHIFYNSLFESGVIDIMKIDNIIAEKGMINFGLYAYMNQNRKVKLSNSLQLSDLKQFATVLNEFITYLKEKPESRDISYIAKEKHTVKCCYRCGFVYKGDNLCPKCGSKMNE
ncbi:MAG: hypothetical protein K0S41_1035 [Anaerocolumna sp.]|jgi:hypothetical protein|nr:hypothetical protein [Anaerocolumna sp.]